LSCQIKFFKNRGRPVLNISKFFFPSLLTELQFL